MITADAGYHSTAALEHLDQANVQAFSADNGYRQRDPRYADQAHHQAKGNPLHDKRPQERTLKLFGPEDFHLDKDTGICTCPAGKRLHGNGSNCVINGLKAIDH